MEGDFSDTSMRSAISVLSTTNLLNVIYLTPIS